MIENKSPKIRTIIAGVNTGDPDFSSKLAELKGLAVADNLDVVEEIVQNLEHRSAGLYFGQGKISEIYHLMQANSASLLVVNDELTPTQIRNLENKLDARVIDRTELILEIFENRAQTKTAKIQVEIAKMQYAMPRIHPSEKRLDQQGGGGGGLHNRGAGETASEINRRTILKQISELKSRLKKIESSYKTQSSNRNKSNLSKVALVGYTNAGKSTTFNQLADFSEKKDNNNTFVADMLFATLDTTVKLIELPNHRSFILSDTVGFISGLPHQLVESFKTTLSEAKDADLLINVVDYSDLNYQDKINTTKKVLNQIGAGDVPMITFFNKADLGGIDDFPILEGNDLVGSAYDKDSIKELVNLIEQKIFVNYKTVDLLIPFDKGDIFSQIKENFLIRSTDYLAEGIKVRADLNNIALNKFNDLVVR